MFDTLTRLSATERIPTLTMTIPTPAMKPPKSHRMDEKLAVGLKVPKQLNPSGGKLNARAPNPFPQRNKDTPNYSCFCNLPVKRRIQACVRCRLGFESDKARNLEKYILGCDAPQTTAGTSTSTSPLTESKSGTSSGSGGTTTSGSKVTTTTGMKTSTQTPDATGGAVGKMEDGGLRMKLLLLWAAVYPLPWMLRHIGILPIRLARGGSGGGGVRS